MYCIQDGAISDFTESGNGDALAYYIQAINAFDQGDLQYSEELCRNAAKLYERQVKMKYRRYTFSWG